MIHMKIHLGTAAVLLLLAGCGGEPPLESALTECEHEAARADAIIVVDEGSTILIRGAKEDDWTQVGCVLAGLDAPRSLISSIEATNALMGRQSKEEGDYSYEWSYSATNGLEMVITE
jgi:hypothetical protein